MKWFPQAEAKMAYWMEHHEAAGGNRAACALRFGGVMFAAGGICGLPIGWVVGWLMG